MSLRLRKRLRKAAHAFTRVDPIFRGSHEFNKHVLGTYQGRKYLGEAAALGLGGYALAGGFAGAGAAGAAGGGLGGAGIGGAAYIDPFLAGGGAGAAGWAPLAGGLAGTIGGAAGAAGGAGAGTQGGFWGGLLGQGILSGGANLASGYLQNRAQGKADKANRKAIEDRIRQALAALSPEQIMALSQRFLPQMAANANAQGQTAISGLREMYGKAGLAESPYAATVEAGLRAKLAGDVQQRAFEQAFNLAGQQASAITGAPYVMQQPQTGYADAFTNTINQAYFAKAIQDAQRRPQQSAYQWPGQPYPWMG